MKKDDGTYVEATGIGKALAEEKVNNINAENVTENIRQIPVKEFFGTEHASSGVLGLIVSKKPNATLKSLPDDATTVVSEATIGELTDNRLLVLDATTEANLTKVFKGDSWKNLTLTTLITSLVEIAARSA